MEKHRRAIDTGEGGDIMMVIDLGLERFQAQLTSIQMGNPGLALGKLSTV